MIQRGETFVIPPGFEFVQLLSHMIGISWPWRKRHLPYVSINNDVAFRHTSIFPMGGRKAWDIVVGTLFVCAMISGQTVVALWLCATVHLVLHTVELVQLFWDLGALRCFNALSVCRLFCPNSLQPWRCLHFQLCFRLLCQEEASPSYFWLYHFFFWVFVGPLYQCWVNRFRCHTHRLHQRLWRLFREFWPLMKCF